MRISIVISLIVFCLGAGAGQAATLTVKQGGDGDFATIGAALAAAAAEDQIMIWPGTYSESLHVTKSVTLKAALGPHSVVLDGLDSFRQVHVDGPYAVVLQGLHFTRGYGDNGSALLIWNTPTVTVDNCLFTSNHAYESNTLHVRHYGTHVTVTGCEFRQNLADLSSAAVGVGWGGYVMLEGSTFVDNHAVTISGAVNASSATLDVWDCLFLRNSSGNSGALAYTTSEGQIVGNTFVDNKGPLRGSVYFEFGVVFRANIVVGEKSGPGVTDFGGVRSCNLYFDNARGPLEGSVLVADELAVDPRFCDRETEAFGLCMTSPALVANNGCGDMGVYPRSCNDCDVVAVQAANWGSLKAMYR